MPDKTDKPATVSLMVQIKVKGHLRDDWSDWFGGLAISHDESGNTIFTGDVKDQSALHGLLKRIRDAGLELISINPINITTPIE